MSLRDLLALALLSLALFSGAGAMADFDDALITYRYAANIAAGRGFAYNPGESIWGTSTPLYTLLLGLASALGVAPPRASHALGLMSGIAVVLLAALLAGRLSGSRTTAWLAGLWCAGSGPLAVWSLSGMETLSYTSLMLGTWAAAHTGRSGLAAALAGLAFLMRTDGAILLPSLILYLLLVERRAPLRALAIWLLVVTPWCLFALWRFSALLPHSFAAKRTHVKLAAPDWFVRYFLYDGPWRPTLVAAAAALARPWRSPREPNSALALSMGLWLALYAAAYSLAGLDFYEWYCIPALPVLAVFAALGVDTVAGFATRAARGRDAFRLVAGALLLWSVLQPRTEYVRKNRAYLDSVEETRRHIGEWLAHATPPGAVIGTGAVGQIGYYSGRRIDDHARLVSDAADVPADYVVGHDDPTGRLGSFGDDPAFLRNHALIAVFVPPAPHDGFVYRVFQRLGRERGDPPPEPTRTTHPAPGSVALGSVVDFTDRAARARLASGWSEPEAGFGTWALGGSSTLRLAEPLGAPARLTLELAPFSPPGSGTQVVSLERHGVPLASRVLEPRWQEWVVDLPGVASAADGADELTFRFARALSPREVGESDDPRPLAVAFRRLLVEPMVAPRPSALPSSAPRAAASHAGFGMIDAAGTRSERRGFDPQDLAAWGGD